MRSKDTELRFGPYSPPSVMPGDELQCEINGLCVVSDYHDAPIMWPKRKVKGRPSLIVCLDLVTALARETNEAVAFNWGVSLTTVWRWRVSLGIVGTLNEGSHIRLSELMEEKRRDDPETFIDPGSSRLASMTKEERTANGKASQQRPWTAEEDQGLGTAPDEIIAAQLGRTTQAVRLRKNSLGITTAGTIGIPRKCAICGYEWISVGDRPERCANPTGRHKRWRKHAPQT